MKRLSLAVILLVCIAGCGGGDDGPSDEQQVTDLVNSFYLDIGSGQFEEACEAMSPYAMEAIAYKDESGTNAKYCGKLFESASRFTSEKSRAMYQRLEVDRVVVSDDGSAVAILNDGKSEADAMLVGGMETGEWKIDGDSFVLGLDN